MSLQVRELARSFGPRRLFSGVSFVVNPGERVALVGDNGSGKSTLMRVILGDEHADAGEVVRPRGSEIGYLPQEIFLNLSRQLGPEGLSQTLWALGEGAFSRLRAIESEMRALEEAMASGRGSPTQADRHERLHAEFERLGGYRWQAQLVRVLKGLGFSENRFHDALTTFSGGWQMRAFFARLLLRQPEFLLLDEPTNYLDIRSIAFLEEFLGDYPGGILVVSHDRYFLDRLATSVVALMPEGARTYRGNYSDFLDAREGWAEEAAAAQARLEREKARIQRFVDRFRAKNTKATQVQSRIKMLERMQDVEQVGVAKTIHFSFPPCVESGEVVLDGQGIGRRYGDTPVLAGLDFKVYRGDRLAIVGENGTGKTTLMRILARQDLEFSGRLEAGHRVHMAYFAQDEEINFEGDETVLARMGRDAPLDMVPRLRGLLGAFLFSGDAVEKPVRVLSGGEKSRLGLLRLLMRPCNLLLLDEPTNHLDISSREALLAALLDFPGSLIIVSHDRYFLDCLANRVLVLGGPEGITSYEGNYSEYLWARDQRAAAVAAGAVVVPVTADAGGRAGSVRSSLGGEGAGAALDAAATAQDEWRAKKKRDNERQRRDREIAQVEELIAALETQVRDAEARLAGPEAAGDHHRLAQLAAEHQAAVGSLEAALSRWEILQREQATAES